MSQRRTTVLTWANGLTLLRLALMPCLVVAILGGHALVGLVLFVAAAATDFADGGLARRMGQTSSLGGLFDHATDATFVVSCHTALAARGLVPFALPVLVAAAFAQYVIDSRVAAGRPLRPNPIGRWNGIAYWVLLGTPLVRDAAGVFWPWDSLVLAAGWLLVATTAASMIQRGRALSALGREGA